jgi:hypothetical protein
MASRKRPAEILDPPLDQLFLGMEHISDHDLERYYLGMIPEDSSERSAIEEHLLICVACLERAEQTQDYVDAMRAGAILGGSDLDIM